MLTGLTPCLLLNTQTQEVTKKSGGKKGKGKGGGKGGKGGGGGGNDADEPAAAKAKYKACDTFFSFFLPDPDSVKPSLHPSVLPFSHEEDEEDEEVREALWEKCTACSKQ